MLYRALRFCNKCFLLYSLFLEECQTAEYHGLTSYLRGDIFNGYSDLIESGSWCGRKNKIDTIDKILATNSNVSFFVDQRSSTKRIKNSFKIYQALKIVSCIYFGPDSKEVIYSTLTNIESKSVSSPPVLLPSADGSENTLSASPQQMCRQTILNVDAPSLTFSTVLLGDVDLLWTNPTLLLPHVPHLFLLPVIHIRKTIISRMQRLTLKFFLNILNDARANLLLSTNTRKVSPPFLSPERFAFVVVEIRMRNII